MTALDDLERRLRAVLEVDAQRVQPQHPNSPRQARGARRLRRTSRLRWVSVTTPGCALAVAVAVFLAAPGPTSHAVAATPTMLTFASTARTSLSPLLARLEADTERLPTISSSSGRFVYYRIESWSLVVSVSGKAANTTVVPQVWETWGTSAGPRLQISHDGAAVKPGPLDEIEEANTRLGLTTGPAARSWLTPADVGPFGDLSQLPDTPEALFAKLAAPEGFGSTTPADPVAVSHAMTGLVNYLDYSPASPTFLRTLYETLQLIPGASDLGWTTDRAGRVGIGIGVPTGDSGSRGSVILIVDAHNGHLLDIENVQLNQNGNGVRVPAVVGYDVYFDAATVPGLGIRPTSQRQDLSRR